jgi:uncharacterized protein YjbJ (UPF0337 family)
MIVLDHTTATGRCCSGPAGMKRDLVGRSEVMNLLSRFRNRSRISRGRAKQRIGRATGNRRLQAEGLTDLVSGGARQIGGDVRDKLRKAGRGIERTFDR